MRYEGTIYRPPSEAHSLLIQVTIGCSHNKCIFCKMYKDKKFRVRNIEEVFEDLEIARKRYKSVRRVFLCDGNALCLKTEDLISILNKIKELFPECERVASYGSAKDILRKNKRELRTLNSLGLDLVYLGIESGSDDVLKEIKKGITSEQIEQAGQLIREAGIKLSVTVISGIGGRDRWKEHAIKTAEVVNKINPEYLGLLALRIKEGTKLYELYKSGEFKPLTPKEIILETIEMIKNTNVDNCVFRNNHAANYFFLSGTLSKDKDRILEELNQLLNKDFTYDEEYENYRRRL